MPTITDAIPELRELDLRDPKGISRALLRSGNLAGYKLMAIVAWPRDESRRQQFLTTMIMADRRSVLSWPQPKGPALAKVQAARATALDRLFELFLEHGGPDALTDAPGYDGLNKALDDCLEEVHATGCILICLTTLATHPEGGKKGGASIKKARSILERPMKRKRRWLMGAWSRRKPVAHLCAAAVMIPNRLPPGHDLEPGFPFIEALPFTLALARAYQRFGLSYIPHGQRTPILPPADTWLIPDDLPLPDVPLPRVPLGDEGLAALRGYKAPSPYGATSPR